jgi:hypothetical protein
MSDLLTQTAAAEYLGYSETYLRAARTKGILAGVKPPAHIKRGKFVFFKRTTLDAWLAQFEEREN